MKIIHTSDWHIGRTFEGESLEADQRGFLEWLAAEVDRTSADHVIVAGDIYDRAIPSVEAVSLLDDGLDLIREAGAEVIMLSGNHDSATRLGFGARRQALSGVHVAAQPELAPSPMLLGDGALAVLAIPFLEPQSARAPRPGPDGEIRKRTHQAVLADAIEDGRAALEALAPDVPAIAVAHAFVSGASPSDSERTLSVGGTDRVDPGVLAGFAYVALGHLHSPQTVGAGDRIAYSGSPLAYSFSETAPKSVRLLEIEGSDVSVTEVPIPVGRRASTITGTLEELLEDPSHDAVVDDWVRAVLTDEVIRHMPKETLRRRFPRLVNVSYARRRSGPISGAGAAGVRRESRDPEQTIRDFVEDLRGRPATEAEVTLLDEALAEAIRGADR